MCSVRCKESESKRCRCECGGLHHGILSRTHTETWDYLNTTFSDASVRFLKESTWGTRKGTINRFFWGEYFGWWAVLKENNEIVNIDNLAIEKRRTKQMRTVKQLNEVLTVEEIKSIEDRTKKLLLYTLLTEMGYKTTKMQKYKWSCEDLKKRLIAAIHSDKATIETLKKQVEKDKAKYIAHLDNFFDLLRELKGNVL